MNDKYQTEALAAEAKVAKRSVARLSNAAIARATAAADKARAEAAKPAPTKARKAKAGKGPSKREICADLFARNHERGRAFVLELFEDVGGCTEAGARNYYQRFKSGSWEY